MTKITLIGNCKEAIEQKKNTKKFTKYEKPTLNQEVMNDSVGLFKYGSYSNVWETLHIKLHYSPVRE